MADVLSKVTHARQEVFVYQDRFLTGTWIGYDAHLTKPSPRAKDISNNLGLTTLRLHFAINAKNGWGARQDADFDNPHVFICNHPSCDG